MAKVASIPANLMAQRVAATGKSLLSGADRGSITDEMLDNAADQVFAVLGELKGGAMKLGQALSVAEAGVPPRYADPFRDALTRLQQEAPPMPVAETHRMLDLQLGTGWRKRFARFEDEPIAAASIGQVHKAIWHDGREVAVKVQYPEAEESLRADLKMLHMVSGAFNTLLAGSNARQLIEEFLARTEDELDYRIEAAYQRRFAKEFSGDPQFFVPRVVAAAPKVMVTEWMDGIPLSRIIAHGARADRDRAGLLLAEFALCSPSRVGCLHSDPHPGNFQLRPDNRLGVIDFGACIETPHGIPRAVGRLARCALARDYDGLETVLREEGFVKPGAPIDLGPIVRRIDPVLARIDGNSFHFTREFLQREVARSLEPENISLVNARALRAPADQPEYAMLTRVFGGIVGICAQLDAEGPFLELVEKWVPEFGGSQEVAS
ncbi:ABC1 kinase family protein [Nocardia sp. CDC160]|uniref:ABC1 kinase family protein n=1 Tax=Nocardia sp. CDC160 TaxID=3112166 RepID=UPI002DB6EB18|nr:AarF/UbiB family protein [Nocardia sp. CDC160]MEC3918887.1 AarF/UbiB family protein [Nocardia sp. CDC160]